MKKSLITILMAAIVALSFCSCASIPKKVKEGSSLVIGRLEADVSYYSNNTGIDIDLNGTYHREIQLIIENTETGKKTTIRPDKNGYFYLSNLQPNTTYNYVWAQVTVESTSASRWVNFDIRNWSFTPYEDTVINLGTLRFALDGQRNRVTWSSYEFPQVAEHFKSVAGNSEWANVDIYDYK